MPKQFTDDELALLPEVHRNKILLQREYNKRESTKASMAARARKGRYRDTQRAYKTRPDIRAKRLERYAADAELRDSRRWMTIKSRFGITREQWQALFESQGRCCACCGGGEPKHRYGWAIDHDKETGLIRGILCQPCNRTLGNLGDTLDRVKEATSRYLNYLTRPAPETGQIRPARSRPADAYRRETRRRR